MSCFIVNNKTASSIVTALVEMNHIHVSEAQTFLSLMMMINTLSVNARYSENQSAPEYIFEIQQNNFYEENGDVNYPALMQMITNIFLNISPVNLRSLKAHLFLLPCKSYRTKFWMNLKYGVCSQVLKRGNL